MTPIADLLGERLPAVEFERATSADSHETIYLAREHALEVFNALKNDDALRFVLLAELTAVDFWPREPRFELTYMLVSIEHRLRLRVKIRVAAGDAHMPTVLGIWPAANWLEREVWDLYGIVFDEHPDLRRLLMPEDWEGHPLRKDYPVQIKMKPHVSQPMQVSAEEFRANLERDRRARS